MYDAYLYFLEYVIIMIKKKESFIYIFLRKTTAEYAKT